MRGNADHCALALATCAVCDGTGRLPRSICPCVYRSIFRICFRRYRTCETFPDEKSYIQISPSGMSTGFRRVEYAADFAITVQRVLSVEARKLFDLHFLAGMEEPECSRILKTDRGNFYHRVYQIEITLGRAMLNRGLFPRDYFAAHYLEAIPIRRSTQIHVNWGEGAKCTIALTPPAKYEWWKNRRQKERERQREYAAAA